MTQLEKAPSGFVDLPLIADVEYDENDQAILPHNHTVQDCYEAINMVSFNGEVYGNNAAAMAAYIQDDSLHALWQEYVDQEVYYRPDYLAALVAVAMEQMLNEVGEELSYHAFTLRPMVSRLDVSPALLRDRRDKIKHQVIVWSVPDIPCTK